MCGFKSEYGEFHELTFLLLLVKLTTSVVGSGVTLQISHIERFRSRTAHKAKEAYDTKILVDK